MFDIKMALTQFKRPLTPQEEYIVHDGLSGVCQWLGNVIYWLGVYRGVEGTLRHGHTGEKILFYELAPDYDRLSYYWYRHYGRIYVALDFDFPLGPSDSRNYVVMDNKNRIYDLDVVIAYARAVDGLFQTFLPGIQRQNSLRFCSTSTHWYEYDKSFREGASLRICKQITEKWFCDECFENFGLGELVPPPMPEKRRSHFKAEWEKMKPWRRLEVLERDNFTCRRCHRSPLSEHGVRLAVYHIVPVADGGKTRLDNLETLCAGCAGLFIGAPAQFAK